MEKAAEMLKNTAITLDKYRKNKTLVPPEDLAGKYKIPFQKLKEQLKGELVKFVKYYAMENLTIKNDSYLDEFVETVNRIFKDSQMGKRIGKAAFQDFDIEQVQYLAEEFRNRVYEEAYVPYFHKHTCLYATGDCFVEENKQTPRIYNSLVDKFFSEESGEWITDEEAKKPAVLIYIQEKREEQRR